MTATSIDCDQGYHYDDALFTQTVITEVCFCVFKYCFICICYDIVHMSKVSGYFLAFHFNHNIVCSEFQSYMNFRSYMKIDKIWKICVNTNVISAGGEIRCFRRANETFF